MDSQRLVNVGTRGRRIFGEGDLLKKYLGDEGSNQLKMNSSNAGHSQDVDHRTKEEEAETVRKYSLDALRYYTLTL